eukprot:1394637-Pyramimonas_sp.AAC.2
MPVIPSHNLHTKSHRSCNPLRSTPVMPIGRFGRVDYRSVGSVRFGRSIGRFCRAVGSVGSNRSDRLGSCRLRSGPSTAPPGVSACSRSCGRPC